VSVCHPLSSCCPRNRPTTATQLLYPSDLHDHGSLSSEVPNDSAPLPWSGTALAAAAAPICHCASRTSPVASPSLAAVYLGGSRW
jgi:hypothetical protein